MEGDTEKCFMSLFRLHHLAFAIAVAVAYFTSERLGLIHAWTGYVIAALILIRLLLGLAKRQGFMFQRLSVRPRAASPRMSGIRHPIVGNALTLALLAVVAGTAGTGIAMDKGGTLVGDSIRKHDREREHRRHGPEVRVENFSLGLIAPAYADDDERAISGESEEEEGLLGEVHETLGNAMLFLALTHIAYMLLFRWPMSRHLLFVPRRS